MDTETVMRNVGNYDHCGIGGEKQIQRSIMKPRKVFKFVYEGNSIRSRSMRFDKLRNVYEMSKGC